jgi:hypothetical protein
VEVFHIATYSMICQTESHRALPPHSYIGSQIILFFSVFSVIENIFLSLYMVVYAASLCIHYINHTCAIQYRQCLRRIFLKEIFRNNKKVIIYNYI